MRVLAAMSGGVDSAVAAARAVDAGHDVTGVHLALSPAPATLRTRRPRLLHASRTRTTPAGPPTCSASRSTSGISPSGSAPTSSTTSSPSTPPAAPRTRACAATRRSSSRRCSTARWRSASTPSSPATTPGSSTAGCAARSTPARTSPTCSAVLHPRPAGRTRCSRSATRPRTQVRAEAAARGLAVADKPDSHDICFIADGDTRGFLARRLGRAARPDRRRRTGAVLGAHAGTFGFTVGQRRGLDLDRPAPTASRATCCRSSRPTNTVVVGPRRAARRRRGARRARRCGPAGARPAARSTARCSCARTAWSARRTVAARDGDGDRRRLARAAARRRGRPGAGDVRRRRGARLGDDHRPPSGRRPTCRVA